MRCAHERGAGVDAEEADELGGGDEAELDGEAQASGQVCDRAEPLLQHALERDAVEALRQHLADGEEAVLALRARERGRGA